MALAEQFEAEVRAGIGGDAGGKFVSAEYVRAIIDDFKVSDARRAKLAKAMRFQSFACILITVTFALTQGYSFYTQSRLRSAGDELIVVSKKLVDENARLRARIADE